MILTGNEIHKEVRNGNIVISPFEESRITTNTYDLTLGAVLLQYTDECIDPRKPNQTKQIHIPQEGYLMKKHEFLLGHSNETLGSNRYVPIIHARSSIARLGLFVHITADLIDIGSVGQTTFQLYATRDIFLKKDMSIGQVSFWMTKGEITLYNGKYQGSKGPAASKAYHDYIA
ncbi:Deoxycytidine triphosphate deaminase [Serratia ficaria]|uniref:dCTP deaminase n=1 Tax=Serratia ficaria TaxID=61651 RepID=UPI001E14B056|nr:dCTP deaminase [Serratia ficaria]NLU17481.1 dCTP deaminase [Serratia liquefaciens]CAI2533133.1 Deoxycytidine triphosphate deaminase [Serratia ficaria]